MLEEYITWSNPSSSFTVCYSLYYKLDSRSVQRGQKSPFILFCKIEYLIKHLYISRFMVFNATFNNISIIL